MIEKFDRILNKYIYLEKKTRKYGTDIKLHPSEIHAIEAIGKNRDPNITKIADYLGIRLASASEVLTKLNRKDLIIKYTIGKNKKEKFVKLTKKGQEAFEGHKKFHERFDDGNRFFETYEDQEKLTAISDFFTFVEDIFDDMISNDDE